MELSALITALQSIIGTATKVGTSTLIKKAGKTIWDRFKKEPESTENKELLRVTRIAYLRASLAACRHLLNYGYNDNPIKGNAFEVLKELESYLSEQIKEDKKATDSKDIHQYTQALVLKLQQQITTESKLSSIQDRIEEVNRGFDKKIIELYPNLTKTEREVCALLRLNLSIKEIASIRNGTTDSVKASRYRIRKKLQVPSGVELEHFIQSL